MAKAAVLEKAYQRLKSLTHENKQKDRIIKFLRTALSQAKGQGQLLPLPHTTGCYGYTYQQLMRIRLLLMISCAMMTSVWFMTSFLRHQIQLDLIHHLLVLMVLFDLIISQKRH